MHLTVERKAEIEAAWKRWRDLDRDWPANGTHLVVADTRMPRFCDLQSGVADMALLPFHFTRQFAWINGHTYWVVSCEGHEVARFLALPRENWEGAI